MKIVIIRDIKANAYHNPQFVASLGGMIRAFADEIAKTDEKENPLAKHPEDYELYHFGEWDELAGTFQLLEKPVQIAAGSNFKK